MARIPTAFDLPPLGREFYDRDVARVARDLLGTLLVRVMRGRATVGRIVEAEAYLADGDAASHSYRGQTRRNASMFGPPGHAYVYAIHSRWCLNAVTEPKGVASAALIRAVEPLLALDLMRRRRAEAAPRDLARGPARLCEAFAIDRKLDGWDLTRGERLWIATASGARWRELWCDSVGVDATARREIATSPRVGVTSAHDLPLRFYFADNPYVSRPARR